MHFGGCYCSKIEDEGYQWEKTHRVLLLVPMIYAESEHLGFLMSITTRSKDSD